MGPVIRLMVHALNSGRSDRLFVHGSKEAEALFLLRVEKDDHQVFANHQSARCHSLLYSISAGNARATPPAATPAKAKAYNARAPPAPFGNHLTLSISNARTLRQGKRQRVNTISNDRLFYLILGKAVIQLSPCRVPYPLMSAISVVKGQRAPTFGSRNTPGSTDWFPLIRHRTFTGRC